MKPLKKLNKQEELLVKINLFRKSQEYRKKRNISTL